MISSLSLPTPLPILELEFDEGDYTGHGVASIFDTKTDDDQSLLLLHDDQEIYSPAADGHGDENLEIEDDSGIVITALECILWKNQEIPKGGESTGPMPSSSSRIEWTVLVGDSAGRVTLLDITDVSFFPPHLLFHVPPLIPSCPCPYLFRFLSVLV
jgi:hypothetical protein